MLYFVFISLFLLSHPILCIPIFLHRANRRLHELNIWGRVRTVLGWGGFDQTPSVFVFVKVCVVLGTWYRAAGVIASPRRSKPNFWIFALSKFPHIFFSLITSDFALHFLLLISCWCQMIFLLLFFCCFSSCPVLPYRVNTAGVETFHCHWSRLVCRERAACIRVSVRIIISVSASKKKNISMNIFLQCCASEESLSANGSLSNIAECWFSQEQANIVQCLLFTLPVVFSF